MQFAHHSSLLPSPCSFFVRPLQGVSYPQLRQGAITRAQYAVSVRRQVGFYLGPSMR